MTRPTILVTGGAGYIGAHTAMRLSDAGFQPVVYDDLSNGHAAFVQWGPLERGDIRDADRLDAVFREYRPAAILHFAARIEVADSLRQPQLYYDVNVGGALAVLAAAARAGTRSIVFSSTCATYGAPVTLPMAEDHPQAPLNPYGHSKLLVEQTLAGLCGSAGIGWTALRYFNAAGADAAGRIGERHEPETHAIPLMLAAIDGAAPAFSLFGTDYPTRDGTAERDYVHVVDLADAHVLAVRRLIEGGQSVAYNIGTGRGTTVRELLAAGEAVTGRPCPVRTEARRPGDAPALVADSRRIRAELGWMPKYDLEAIVASAWRWYCQGRDAKVGSEASATAA